MRGILYLGAGGSIFSPGAPRRSFYNDDKFGKTGCKWIGSAEGGAGVIPVLRATHDTVYTSP